ncbi:MULTISPECIES: lytic transglycosylase domain-containing protein [unclassified Sphingobium]|uniref:lytic transglycosylase domain-containing protein n=1 Tax=unclassified Sphingobium TaxID=2611147 RepID=UPI0035A6C9B8
MSPTHRILSETIISAIITVTALCCTFQAIAKPRGDPASEKEVARCIQLAARGQPWLEKTLWGLRDQEGGWIGAEVFNTNGSHDLGPLQVNSWWVPKLALATGRPNSHVRWWLVHDACFNVSAARWIFLSGLAVTRDYWEAIGVYHSPTEWRQRRYAASVAHHLRSRFGPNVFREPGSSGPR